MNFEPKQLSPNHPDVSNDPSMSPEADSGNWRSFPQFEKLLAVEHPPLVATMEATCRQLETIVQSGSAQERLRARTVLTAYKRTLELYRRFASKGGRREISCDKQPNGGRSR